MTGSLVEPFCIRENLQMPSKSTKKYSGKESPIPTIVVVLYSVFLGIVLAFLKLEEHQIENALEHCEGEIKKIKSIRGYSCDGKTYHKFD
jgi:hypothetical protein